MSFKKINKNKLLIGGLSIFSMLGISLLSTNSLFSHPGNESLMPSYYNNGRAILGHKTITVDPKENYAANGLLWSYPTPRYNPIAITELYTSMNHNLIYDYADQNGNKYYTYEQTYNTKEFYNKSDYTNGWLNEAKYGVQLNNDGSLKLVKDKGIVHSKYYIKKKLWYDEAVGIFASVANDFAITNKDRTITNRYPINDGQVIRPNFSIDTFDTNGLNIGQTRARTGGSITTQHNVTHHDILGLTISNKSVDVNSSISENDSTKMHIFHQTRLHNFDVDQRYWQFGQFYYLRFGSAPQGLNVVIQNGSQNVVFRLRNVRYGDAEIAITGNNNSYQGKNRDLKYLDNGQTPNMLLQYMSNVPSTSINNYGLEKMITFGNTWEQGSAYWQRSQVDARVNLPFWYSSVDKKWYLISDPIIYKTQSFEFTKNQTNKMKSIYPSEWLSGVLNGDSTYKNWFNLRVKTDSSNYWTTPVNWWRFVPKYTISADDYKGILKITMVIPTITDRTYNTPASAYISGAYNNPGSVKSYYRKQRTPYRMDSVSNKTYTFTIDGWRNSVTSFNNKACMSFDDQIKYLASNINVVNQNEITNSIRNKFNNGKDFLNNWEVLKLNKNNDLSISYVSNNLRTGQTTYRVQLRKWVDSNKNLHENKNNGPYKDYLINNFYRIAGRTQLNKSAIKIPENFSNLKVNDITINQLKNMLIQMQADGVKNTIATKYKDTSKEIFTNLGNLLTIDSSSFELQFASRDFQNGIINLKFKLSKIYDTDINNSTFVNKKLEGTIAIYGFKTDNSNSLYSLNNSAIYADKYGVVVGNPSIGTNVIGNNNSFVTNNTFKNNDYVILSQQYIHSKNARAALVFDPNRSNKIIIKLFDANNDEIKEYVFNAPSMYIKVLSKDDIIYADGYGAIAQYLDKTENVTKDEWSLYDENKNLLDRNDFYNSSWNYFRIEKVHANVFGNNYSYQPKLDLYWKVPITNSLYWNRMIAFNSDENNNVFSDKMLIFNQGIASYYSDANNNIELLGNSFSSIIDLASTNPQLQNIDSVNNNLKNDFIVSAATFAQYNDKNSQMNYSLAFITTGTDKKTYLKIFTLDEDLINIKNTIVKDITSAINFYPDVNNNGSIFNPALYYQPPEFYLTNKDNKWNIFLLSANSNSRIGVSFDLRYKMYKYSDVGNENSKIKQLSFIDPITKKTLKQLTPFVNNNKNISDPILTNHSFANNFNKWNLTYANKNTNQYFAISIDLAKLCSSDTTNIDINVQSILSNNNFNSENDWVYSLKDDTSSTSYLAFDQTNTNFVNVASKFTTIKIDAPDNMRNINLSQISSDQLKQIVTPEILQAKLSNLNYQNILNRDYTFNNTVVDYFNGRVYTNLVLNSNFDFKFDNTNKISLPIVISNFKKQKQATGLKLTDVGINYFANLAPYEIKDKINEIVKNNQLSRYFSLSNYPDVINKMDEALLGYNQNSTNTNLAINQITFDQLNKKIIFGLNLQKGYIQVNNNIQLANNVTVFVDIDLPTMTNLNNIELKSTIFGNDATKSLASSYKEKIINNLSSGEASNKLVQAITEKFANIGIKKNEVFLTSNIQFDDSKGELYVVAQIPKLLTFGSDSDNIKVTIKNFKNQVATSIQKRVDHKANIAPSKLQAYLNENIQKNSLDFVQVINPVEGNNPTKIIAANVIDFNDNLGTATVSFSANNFYAGGLNQLPNAASQSGTLNATIKFDNLFGTSDFLTSIKKEIDIKKYNQYANTNAQMFANKISKDSDYATNFLYNTNSISNAADNTTFKLLSSSFDNKNGTVQLVYQLDKVKLNNGNDENKNVTFSTTVSGFKKVLGPTTYKLKDNLPNWTFDQVKQEISKDINNIKLLIDIENPVDDYKFNNKKLVENDDGSYTIFVMVDKYYANDQYYTMIENQEIKITISKNKNNYLLRSITFNVNKDQDQTISSLTDSINKNINYISLIGGSIAFFSLTIIICLLIVYQFRKNSQNNKE